MKKDEVIANLNKTIDKLRKRAALSDEYREAFNDQVRKNRHLARQLEIKRKVIRVEGVTEEELEHYLLQIVDVIDTPEGMYIKVILPSK